MSFNKYTIGFLLCVCVIFYFCFHCVPNNELDKKYKYTIATITNFDFPADGGEVAEVIYFVNNKSFKTIISLTYDDKINLKIGQKFYIKYNPEDPDNSKIIYDIIVPDTLKIIPCNGWTEIK